jgi:hypothetical protein
LASGWNNSQVNEEQLNRPLRFILVDAVNTLLGLSVIFAARVIAGLMILYPTCSAIALDY